MGDTRAIIVSIRPRDFCEFGIGRVVAMHHDFAHNQILVKVEGHERFPIVKEGEEIPGFTLGDARRIISGEMETNGTWNDPHVIGRYRGSD